MKRLTERLENRVINVKYASQHETAIHSAACVGYLGKKTAYGYMWRYES